MTLNFDSIRLRDGSSYRFTALVESVRTQGGDEVKVNEDFVKAYKAANKGENPNLLAVGGYDGMHLIYEALKKTGGKTDGDAFVQAAKGMAWESPRGPMSIDPQTRDVVQTVYFRRVEKSPDGLVNVEFDKVENVKDPVKERMKKK